MLWNTFVDAVSSLWFSRQRTLLATIGIVIGSGSVIAMINVGQMVQAEAMSEFKKLGPDLIALNITTQPGQIISYDMVGKLSHALSEQPLITPRIRTDSNWVYSHSTGNTSVIGADESFFQIAKPELLEGRFLNRLDGKGLFAVVGSKALRLSGVENTLQPELMDQIQIDDTMVQVVGKLKPYGYNPMLGVDIDRSILLPIDSLRRFLTSDMNISRLIIKAPAGEDVTAVGAQAKSYLQSKKKGLEVRINLASHQIEAIKKQSRLLSLLLGTMGSISLLVGGIGIMNVMLVSVAERRKEIGLRMAVGAPPSSIITLFLVESVVLTSLGGILGLALGTGGAMLMGYFTNVAYFFSTLAAVLGVGVSAIIGIFFGYYPAFMASRMNPIDALNAE